MATLKDIARSIAAAHNMKEREADKFVSAIVDTILEGLASDRIVKIKGFGTFKLTAVRDRESVNVNTGERVLISGHDKISFTPENGVRDLINKPFAQFETVVLSDSFDADAEIETEETEEVVEQEEPVTVKPTVEEIAVEEPSIQIPVTKVEEKVAMVEQKVSLVEEKVNAVEEKTAAVEEKVAVVAEKVSVIEEKTAAMTELPTKESTTTAEEVTNPEEEITNPEEEKTEEPGEVYKVEEEDKVKEEESPIMEEEIYEGEEQKTVSLFTCIVSNVVIAILAFAAGFFLYGYLNTGKPATIEEPVTADSVKTAAVEKVEKEKLDTIGEKVDSVKPKVEDKPVVKAEEKQETIAETQVATSKYDDDARVRTGAYIIIGVDKTITVSQGQTLKSISKFYLGPDMECYIEALNGVKEVKAGDKLKIPKLQLKKKVKK